MCCRIDGQIPLKNQHGAVDYFLGAQIDVSDDSTYASQFRLEARVDTQVTILLTSQKSVDSMASHRAQNGRSGDDRPAQMEWSEQVITSVRGPRSSPLAFLIEPSTTTSIRPGFTEHRPSSSMW